MYKSWQTEALATAVCPICTIFTVLDAVDFRWSLLRSVNLSSRRCCIFFDRIHANPDELPLSFVAPELCCYSKLSVLTESEIAWFSTRVHDILIRTWSDKGRFLLLLGKCYMFFWVGTSNVKTVVGFVCSQQCGYRIICLCGYIFYSFYNNKTIQKNIKF